MSLLPNVNFIKARTEKHLSSSTLFITCTTVNSIGFTYSWKLENNIQDVVTRHHILVKSIQEFLYHDIFCIHFVGFAIIESYLRHSRCLAKTHHYLVIMSTRDIQFQEHSLHHGLKIEFSIPKSEFFQPLSNHLQIMLLHEHEKNQILRKIKMKILRVLPLHWFFTSDSTTTKTPSITCEKKLVSKSQCFAQIC